MPTSGGLDSREAIRLSREIRYRRVVIFVAIRRKCKNKTLGIGLIPKGFVVSVELAGFEPATLCLQSRCATSCAIAP